jgi:hypothetical protein
MSICSFTSHVVPCNEMAKRLTVLVFLGSLSCAVPVSAQVNPVNDFFGGLSVFTIGGDATDATRHTPVGWQASASQKIKSAEKAATRGDSPISIVGDVAGQFRTLDNGRRLHAYEYMGGVRVRAGRIRKATSVFGHALVGGTTRSIGATSETGFMMGYGGGIDAVTPGGAYALGVRTQFDWLPARVNGAWAANQFRLAFGIVIMVRYWD